MLSFSLPNGTPARSTNEKRNPLAVPDLPPSNHHKAIRFGFLLQDSYFAFLIEFYLGFPCFIIIPPFSQDCRTISCYFGLLFPRPHDFFS